MSDQGELHVDLVEYLFGEPSEQERRAVEDHLATCPQCREEVDSLIETQTQLAALPPEAMLDGPPPDADLLLQRTIRQVRKESTGARSRTRAFAAVAAVVVAAAAIGVGVVVGRTTDGSAPPVAAPPPASAQPAGTRFASGTDAATGARLTVGVTPAAGWVRVNASVTGIPAGQKCRVVVVGKDGTREQAGSWLVSDKGAKEGTNLDGSALIDPGNVASVLVENTDGKQFVQVAI
ncbi:anti-sigma factor [Amycolatopsis sp. GM8]|uniref:anti-sigma factor family protein n=1 Tax=Amycolatopsis sp. GM8 TaxID=2896530 RepID=UPI001F1AB266|nr:zf-HC2 domain-containing protein [Amycolatopsis sp. GM8]